MNPDRGIFHTYIHSYSLYTRLNDPNTLTQQIDGTNNAPQGSTARPRYIPQLSIPERVF